ncbi:MAG: sulfotransferase [Trebonia sp.]
MRGVRPPLDGTAAVRYHVAGLGGSADSAPVIVLTYPHAGGEQLSARLARHPDLACTTGTGILPMCEQIAAAWRAVDGRPPGPPSQLAETSTRALATSMITALLARQGKRRWCEVAIASPDAAGVFVRLFPGTRVVCLHRSGPDVVQAAVQAGSWGLAGPAYASFTSAHPASGTAALIAYWAARTTALMAFEQEHPGICQRVRYEDLAGDSLSCLSEFLGLQDPGFRPAARLHEETAAEARGAAGPAAEFPAGPVPPSLLERANGLMENLGYRSIAEIALGR